MTSMKMEAGRMTTEEIQEFEQVRAHIEYCLIHYMSRTQTTHCLYNLANIDPYLTEFVWNLLQQQTPEFFKVYNLMLAGMDQTLTFNQALSLQAQLMTIQQNASQPPMHQQPDASNGLLPRSGASRPGMYQQQIANNGLRSNASPVLMHQQQLPDASNGLLQHHSNGPQKPMYQQQNGSNGLLRPSNASSHQVLMHQQQQPLMHQQLPPLVHQTQQPNGSYGHLHRSNGSQTPMHQEQQPLMHQQHNGSLHHSISPQTLMQRQQNASNGPQQHFNGFRQ